MTPSPRRAPVGAPTNPATLRWAEVDPRRHAFDPSAAPAVVRSLPAAARVPTSRRRGLVGGDEWAAAMDRDLVSRYGRWASGWRWARGEGDVDGGPVTAWCCPEHSITTRGATLTAVTAALVEWRSWLEELAARFDELLPVPASATEDEVLEIWERAVAQLVTLVVARTEAESSWYRHCRLVLAWFLSAAGVPEDRHATLLEDAVGGRFHSWSEPEPSAVARVAERLAAGVARRPGA
ncbi:hypothetical protein GC089_01890 [Cellulomonas sp. JZ18]|uniref:hypothetical protein n=1 Tax=Cellulomonas sp. JZ18 TaxID=2654191 RepID=UPI0012D3DDBD|nr:hypothetical protein [Cellulomonas sp. JZ18]QGQ18244.1 hypothetical protein GC089_01890 [Cellulomonas sp. JZ18]